MGSAVEKGIDLQKNPLKSAEKTKKLPKQEGTDERKGKNPRTYLLLK